MNKIVTKPMTIEQLIKQFHLSYPFILVKTTSEARDTAYGVVIPQGCAVTFTKRMTPMIHEGFVDKQGFHIMDTPSWQLVEASGENVITLDVYKALRKKRKIILK